MGDNRSREGGREAGSCVTSGQCPDLVIFDCDGVLVDSEAIVAGVLAGQLRQLDVEITDEECARELTGLSQDMATKRRYALLGTAAPEVGSTRSPGPLTRPFVLGCARCPACWT